MSKNKNHWDEIDFEIDKYNLDDEWVKQPRNYHNCAESLANAKKDVAFARNELKLIEAELKMKIHKEPQKYGLSKATDKLLEAAVVIQQDYQRATNRLIEAEHLVDLIQAATRGLEHKKSGIEGLVYLESRDYYGELRPPKGTQEQMRRVERDAAFGRSKTRRAESG